MESSKDAISSARFLRETGIAAGIAELVEPVVEGLGFRLVRVQVSGRDGQTVQIMVERPDGTLTIEDCETVSRSLSAVLDVHDPIRGAYRLEVSSPGIDRPLVRASDFEAWKGYEARIEVKEPIEGRKRFRGRLEGVENGEVLLEADVPGQGLATIGFKLDLIGDAKLLMTDELIREALRRSKTGGVGGGESGPGAGGETRRRGVN